LTVPLTCSAWRFRFPPLVIVVFVISIAVWLPCLRNDFVDWDDLNMIVHNPRFNPPTWANAGWYWFHPAFDLYWPMTTTLWAGLARVGWLDVPDQFGGHLNPAVFHLASALLHSLATAILFLVLVRFTRNASAAAFGALLFGVHPIQVEPVAFAGVLDNPLAGLFSLLAIWQYMILTDPANALSSRAKKIRWTIASIALLLAMLSKPSAVVIPPLALMLDIGMHRRSLRPALRSIAPWILLVLPCVIWTMRIQHGHDTLGCPVWFRPMIALDATGFYLQKIAWPFPLAVDYGRSPHFVFTRGVSWPAVSASIGLLVVALLSRNRYPRLCASLLIFLIALLPNSGLLPFDFQMFSTVADRYAYLAMVGVALLGAIAIQQLPRLAPLGFLLLFALVVQTETQIAFWKNGETLFRHALLVNPNSWMSDINLAGVLADRSPDQALRLCQRAIELRPDRADPWNTIGTIRQAQGDRDGAIQAFTKAHELAPANLLFQENLARTRQAVPCSQSP
jgi:hypothetical protein